MTLASSVDYLSMEGLPWVLMAWAGLYFFRPFATAGTRTRSFLERPHSDQGLSHPNRGQARRKPHVKANGSALNSLSTNLSAAILLIPTKASAFSPKF